MSEDKAIEEILRFVENSDGESNIKNNEDLTNNNLSLLNGNEDIFLQEQTDIGEENEQEKEDERRTQRYPGFNLFFGIAVVKSYPFVTLPQVNKDENLQPIKLSQPIGQYIYHNSENNFTV